MSDMATVELKPRKITVEEYHRMVDVGILDGDERVELLDGIIVEMTPIGKPHWVLHWQIATYLTQQFGAQAAVVGQASLPLGHHDEPQPDVIVFAPSAVQDLVRPPTPAEVYAFIEVADSSLAKDLGPKRELYEKFSIEDYLVVDIASSRILHYSASDATPYAEPRILAHGDTFALGKLPGVPLEAGRLLPPR
jgi:Uma2 family endonuclease